MNLAINCAVCSHQVDRMMVDLDIINRQYVFTVHCHGERDVCRVPINFIDEARTMSGNDVVGIAFTAKSLEAA